jgi:hypothetical protein
MSHDSRGMHAVGGVKKPWEVPAVPRFERLPGRGMTHGGSSGGPVAIPTEGYDAPRDVGRHARHTRRNA